MKTLDEILSQRSTELRAAKLGEALDIKSWTTKNRDAKMTEVRGISEDVAMDAVKFVRELLETEIEGKPILYWQNLKEFTVAEVELLMTFREELDTQSRDTLATLPVDYNWLNNAIHDRLVYLGELNDKLETALEGGSESL